MRLAALYDIHGNLPALEAVLAEIRDLQVDQVIVGGDVLPGPMPRETVELLAALEIRAQFILGNGEVAVLEAMAGKEPAQVPEPYRPIIHWNAQQLSREHRRMMSGWPKTASVDAAGIGEVLFCHATPRDENEIFTRITPEEQLAPLFGDTAARLVVCGHTHMQFDRMVGSTRVVNAGSVGMPFGEPGAYWLLLGQDVQLRRTAYDLDRAAERIRATSYPGAAEFAANNVLHPPSDQQMLDIFERAAANATR
ncbi:MAG TPA: metallophosphoesterase family protein [Candidatus Acidoferrales bacterium]|nr:metallophosphoesterase family protein [Candidatus Acidoferrales bacterium]